MLVVMIWILHASNPLVVNVFNDVMPRQLYFPLLIWWVLLLVLASDAHGSF
jgi:hypothetical protein